MKSSSVIGVWILECIEYEVVFSFLQVEMGVDKRIGEAFHVFFFFFFFYHSFDINKS